MSKPGKRLLLSCRHWCDPAARFFTVYSVRLCGKHLQTHMGKNHMVCSLLTSRYPHTSGVRGQCPIELRDRICVCRDGIWHGAGYGNRTRLFGLGSRHSTDELILHMSFLCKKPNLQRIGSTLKMSVSG